MKSTLFTLLLLLLALPTQAQSKAGSPLRDSLQQAVEALSYHPDSIDLRLRKARWNIELEQYDYARDEYSKVLRRDPHNVAALFFRAYCNTRLHRYTQARNDYLDLLAIVPGHFEGQLGLTLLYQRDHHPSDALDAANRLVAEFPDSAVAWAARAGIEMEQQRFDPAEYDYGEALRRDSANQDWRLARADLRIRLGRYTEARADLDCLVRQGTPRAALREWYSALR